MLTGATNLATEWVCPHEHEVMARAMKFLSTITFLHAVSKSPSRIFQPFVDTICDRNSDYHPYGRTDEK